MSVYNIVSESDLYSVGLVKKPYSLGDTYQVGNKKYRYCRYVQATNAGVVGDCCIFDYTTGYARGDIKQSAAVTDVAYAGHLIAAVTALVGTAYYYCWVIFGGDLAGCLCTDAGISAGGPVAISDTQGAVQAMADGQEEGVIGYATADRVTTTVALMLQGKEI